MCKFKNVSYTLSKRHQLRQCKEQNPCETVKSCEVWLFKSLLIDLCKTENKCLKWLAYWCLIRNALDCLMRDRPAESIFQSWFRVPLVHSFNISQCHRCLEQWSMQFDLWQDLIHLKWLTNILQLRIISLATCFRNVLKFWEVPFWARKDPYSQKRLPSTSDTKWMAEFLKTEIKLTKEKLKSVENKITSVWRYLGQLVFSHLLF